MLKQNHTTHKNFFIYIFKNFPYGCIFYCLITLLAVLMDTGTALFIAPIFDLVVQQNNPGASSQLSFYTKYILQCVAFLGLSQTVLTMMFVLLTLIIVRNIFLVLSIALSIQIKERMIYQLKLSVFKSVLESRWDFFLNYNQGMFLNVLTREINNTQGAFIHFTSLIISSLKITFFLCLAFWISWKLTAFCFITAFIFLLPFLSLTKWNYRWGQRAVDQASQANSIIQEAFALAKIIHATANQAIIYQHLEQAQENLFRLTRSSQMMTNVLQHSYYPLGLLSVILSYYISLQMKVSLAELSIIFFSMWRTIPLFSGFLQQISLFAEQLPSFNRVRELELEAVKTRIPTGEYEFTQFKDKIELKNIVFSYSDPSSPVLKKIDLTISKGKKIALVGHSGSGKSTLADIIMGFHTPQQGKFLIDGIPFENLNIHSYRRHIGYVPQNSSLFNTSIRNNFLWIHPELSENDIWKACEQAYAKSFIQSFPEGLDTIVGDRGIKLSGGQTQRLALARALAIQPDLLILDEATSSLDSESESFIQESIDALPQNMTLFIIAHRLSTIKSADWIYVFEKGMIKESGTFEQLCQINGIFYSMLKKQQI
jgi:ABC-type multidrug transport system fused ATPase/permease subunit